MTESSHENKILTVSSTELVVAMFGKVLAFDPDTGQQLWTCDTGVRTYVRPSIVAHEGAIFALVRSHTLAIRTGGRGDVTDSHVLWRVSQGSNVPSPVYHQGHLYFVRENGAAFCLDAKTGKTVYDQRIRGGVYSSPVLIDGKLYGISRGGRAFVLAAQPRFELLAQNDMRDGSRFDASPAVADGRLLIRSYRFLYCVGKG